MPVFKSGRKITLGKRGEDLFTVARANDTFFTGEASSQTPTSHGTIYTGKPVSQYKFDYTVTPSEATRKLVEKYDTARTDVSRGADSDQGGEGGEGGSKWTVQEVIDSLAESEDPWNAETAVQTTTALGSQSKKSAATRAQHKFRKDMNELDWKATFKGKLVRSLKDSIQPESYTDLLESLMAASAGTLLIAQDTMKHDGDTSEYSKTQRVQPSA